MKHLVVIRHAKSSWENYSLPDFDRPLSKRGQRDATLMGNLLRKKVGSPDLILTSPAVRALTTARLIAEEIPVPGDRIVSLSEMYRAEGTDLLEVAANADPGADTLFLVGHNPAVTELVNLVADCGISNLPTCGVVSVSFNVENWTDIRLKSGRFLFFEYPKKALEP